MKKTLLTLISFSLIAVGLSACGGNGSRNIAPDRTVSQPRGSY